MPIANSILGNTAPAAPTNATTVSDLFSAIDTSVIDAAQSQAQAAISTGDTEEESAYGTSAAIEAANARLAQAGGTVQQAQEALQLRQTEGTQRAAIAGGGFQAAGSALDLLRSSTRQGLLQQQITGMNAQLEAQGFQASGQAATAEGAAAGAAANAASVTSASDSAMAQASKTNAVNEAAALGVNIPGIGSLSATSIPTVNPVTVGLSGPGSTGLSPFTAGTNPTGGKF